jgi:nicotinate phosphoribosyltransferase
LRGYKHVKIFVSGGIDEDSIPGLVKAGVDGFGVGTVISNARTVNYAMDIVEVEGKPAAKRGKFSGAKSVFRCPQCFEYKIQIETTKPFPNCQTCGTEMESMLLKYIEHGERVRELPSIDEKRSYVMKQLRDVKLG